MLSTLATLLLPIALMSVLSRAAGGGIVNLPSWAGRLPEILFALPFGLCLYLTTDTGLYGYVALGALVSYFGMETGHGTAFSMGRNPKVAQSGRKQFLSRVVDPVCKAVGAPLGGSFYCWLFMGLKGLWIGLPAFPFGLGLAVLWPLGYELGWRFRRGNEPTAFGEWLTGAAAGIVVGLSLLF